MTKKTSKSKTLARVLIDHDGMAQMATIASQVTKDFMALDRPEIHGTFRRMLMTVVESNGHVTLGFETVRPHSDLDYGRVQARLYPPAKKRVYFQFTVGKGPKR